jgi:hypothetical protein
VLGLFLVNKIEALGLNHVVDEGAREGSATPAQYNA